MLQTLVEAPAIPLRDGQTQRSYHGLTLCIPVLDEEGAIGHVLNAALRAAASLQPCGIDELEIIVVDDGSRDRTPDIVGTFPEVRLIRHAGNRGYGAALKTAFASAQPRPHRVHRRRRHVSAGSAPATLPAHPPRHRGPRRRLAARRRTQPDADVPAHGQPAVREPARAVDAVGRQRFDQRHACVPPRRPRCSHRRGAAARRSSPDARDEPPRHCPPAFACPKSPSPTTNGSAAPN